jgi:hypothetical protein
VWVKVRENNVCRAYRVNEGKKKFIISHINEQ